MLFLFVGLAFADVPKKYEVPKKLPYDDIRGGQLYNDLCWQCHGKLAKGDGPLSAELNAPALLTKITPERIPELVDIIQWGKGSMPGYEQLIDKHDSKRILKWIRCINKKTGKNNCDANRRNKEKEKAAKTKQPVEQVGSCSTHSNSGQIFWGLMLFFLCIFRKRVQSK